jgi:type III pantothenate kinase
MNLIIDIGNTRVKGAVFRFRELVERFDCERVTSEWLEAILKRYPEISRAIVSSTRNDMADVVAMLDSRVGYVVGFEPGITPVPIANDYHTPLTLGADRLAAAVGAAMLYPESDLLIVDFGTAITIDFVEGGSFRGGNISPGVTTRFRALADYTAKLPLCSPTEAVLDYGRTTYEAIEQGVMRGVEHEIRGYVELFLKKNAKKSIIFTGGDAKYFAKQIKNAIFADCEPVFFGLNAILEYNAEKQ